MSLRHRRRSGLAGGAGAPNPTSYSSAATYQMAVNGSANDQYNRVFDVAGPDGSSQSNAIIGLQGQRAGMRRSRRHKRGGFWGEVINQAVVPFSLLAMQQRYGKKGKRGGSRKKCICNNNNGGSRRRRRGTRRRRNN